MRLDDSELGQVLAHLARRTGLAEENLSASLRMLAEASARALLVARVNIWEMAPDRSRLRCVESYEAGGRSHTPGEELLASDYPSYFAALEGLRAIAAFDARDDSRTAELRDSYLARHGITTMLDAPVFVAGQLAGVVCHEHVGDPRPWTEPERSFAASIADFVALCLEADRRARAEREKRALQARLYEAQRLEALGLLAGGVVHDFKNLLVTILGRLAMARAELPGDNPAVAHVGQAEVAAQHAVDLCWQVMQQTQLDDAPRGSVDLNGLCGEMVDLLSGTLPPDARLLTQLAPRLPPLDGNAVQLRQVVMNLIANAAEALGPGGGRVVVRTGVEPAAAGDAAARLFLAVEDDGCGMTEEAVGRLFKPLSSTKGPGRGLGLASARSLIRAHGGRVSVHSTPGAGTTFHVSFPVPAEPPVVAPAAPQPATRLRTMLVADDDPTTRLLLKDLFEPSGWQVILARDGVDVLETVRVFRAIDLVLLDYRMPRLDGRDCCERLHGVLPGVPVVIASADPAAAAEFAGLIVAGMLTKPFAPDELIRLVNRLVPV